MSDRIIPHLKKTLTLATLSMKSHSSVFGISAAPISNLDNADTISRNLKIIHNLSARLSKFLIDGKIGI